MSTLFTYDEPMPYDMSPDEMHGDSYPSRPRATYGDDSVKATFSASLTAIQDGAGQWREEVDDVQIEDLSICGVRIDPRKLEREFPALFNALCELGKDQEYVE